MDDTDVTSTVREVMSAVLQREIDPDLRRIDEPRWDSMKHLEMMFALEDAFAVRFTEEEAAGLTSFVGVVDTVGHKLAA